MTTSSTRTLAQLREDWDDPSVQGDARTALTRELAAAILAAPMMEPGQTARTRVGDLQIADAGWSRERGDAANAVAEPGSEEWRAALGVPERVTLTSDGLGANRGRWCECHAAPPGGQVRAGEWVRYEAWTAEGRVAHGFVHAPWECRRLLQVG